MDFEEDPIFIHDEGEDDYISLRTPLGQHVSKLTDAFSDTDNLWTSKQRRQFNAKIRRTGTRHPEWLDAVHGKSLAQVSERLTHLARIKTYCPRLKSRDYPKSSEDNNMVFRLANEKPDVPLGVIPFDSSESYIQLHGFRELMVGHQFTLEQRSVLARANMYFKEWLTDLLRGLESFVLHKYRAADIVKVHDVSVVVDNVVVEEFLRWRKEEGVQRLPVLDTAVFMHPSFVPELPPIKPDKYSKIRQTRDPDVPNAPMQPKSVANAIFGGKKAKTTVEATEETFKRRRATKKTAVASSYAMRLERDQVTGSVAARDTNIPIGRPFASGTPLMGTPLQSITPLQAESPLQPSSPRFHDAPSPGVDALYPGVTSSPAHFGTYTTPPISQSPAYVPTEGTSIPGSPASVVFTAPPSAAPTSQFATDPPTTAPAEPMSVSEATTKKKRNTPLKRLQPGKRRRNTDDPDDDASDIDDLDEIYSKSFSKANQRGKKSSSKKSGSNKRRKLADEDSD